MAEETTELTLKQLKEEAVKLGIPAEDADKFMSRAPLIATINAIKAAKASNTTNFDAMPSPSEELSTDRNWETKALRMRALLQDQPKVKIMVPLEGKEQPGVVDWVLNKNTGYHDPVPVKGAIQSVILNGYQWLVPKGKYVEVPEQVAEIIQEKYHQTQEAGKEYLIDRIDPKTGRSVREQLS